MHVGHHRADVARTVRTAQPTGAQQVENTLDSRRETNRAWRRSPNNICPGSGMRMFSWLSRNAPIIGSSVKPCTPLPAL